MFRLWDIINFFHILKGSIDFESCEVMMNFST